MASHTLIHPAPLALSFLVSHFSGRSSALGAMGPGTRGVRLRCDDAFGAPLGRHPNASRSCVGQLGPSARDLLQSTGAQSVFTQIEALCFAFTQGMGGDCSER